MRITSEILNAPTLRQVAGNLNMYLDDLNEHTYIKRTSRDFTCKLRVPETNTRYRCMNPISGRARGYNIPCWHGFRDFYREIYSYDPNAIIVTGGFKLPKTVYHNRQNFEDTHEDTGYLNVGSQIYPHTYLDECNHG